jgi:hypothetical protein
LIPNGTNDKTDKDSSLRDELRRLDSRLWDLQVATTGSSAKVHQIIQLVISGILGAFLGVFLIELLDPLTMKVPGYEWLIHLIGIIIVVGLFAAYLFRFFYRIPKNLRFTEKIPVDGNKDKFILMTHLLDHLKQQYREEEEFLIESPNSITRGVGTIIVKRGRWGEPYIRIIFDEENLILIEAEANASIKNVKELITKE